MRFALPLVLVIALLGGCSSRHHTDEAAGTSEGGKPPQAGAATRAYNYDYGFRLPNAAVAAAQARHVVMCAQAGRGVCRVLARQFSQDRDEYSASLTLEVARGIAPGFVAGLSGPVEALGGELTSGDVQIADLSREMAGGVRARADAQARIATSPVVISYTGTLGFFAQFGDALSEIGPTFTTSITTMVFVLPAALPWLVVGVLLLLGCGAAIRRARGTRRRQRPD